MKLRKILTLAVLSFFSLPAISADITGKWNASIETPQGAIPLLFDLTAEGSELTGAISSGQFMPPTAISDGMIDGNNLSWKLTMSMGPNGGSMTINYKATVEDDEMNIISTIEGSPPGGGPPTTEFKAVRGGEVQQGGDVKMGDMPSR